MKSTFQWKLHERCWANKDREKGRKKKSCLFRSRKSQKRRGTKWEKMCLLLLFKQLFIWQSFVTPSPPISPPAAVITYIHFFCCRKSSYPVALAPTLGLLGWLSGWFAFPLRYPFSFAPPLPVLPKFLFFFFALWGGWSDEICSPSPKKEKAP